MGFTGSPVVFVTRGGATDSRKPPEADEGFLFFASSPPQVTAGRISTQVAMFLRCDDFASWYGRELAASAIVRGKHGLVSSRRALAAVAAAIVLAVAGCGSDEGGSANQSAGADAASDPEGGADGGTESILDFTASTVDGEEFDATSLQGQPTVFWFWAPWCPTCASQAPDVTALADDHAGTVNVVGVASLGTQPEMVEFIERTDTSSLIHLNDEVGEVWQRFEITAQSTFAIVDSAGTVTYSGYLGHDELTDQVAELTG
jgi:thiol-disulfide isomerase/thioredoxin